MFLAAFIFILVLLLHYLTKYGTVISRSLCRMIFKVDGIEMDLRAELHDLKAEQNTISMSDEFSKYFKLQRKIEKLGQDVKQRGSTRSQKISAITMAVQIGSQIVQVLMMFLIIYMFRNEPLLEFSSIWFFPFQKLVAFPTGVRVSEKGSLSAVGIGFWIFVCNRVIARAGRLIVLLQ